MLVKRQWIKKIIERHYPKNIRYKFLNFLEKNSKTIFSLLFWGLIWWEVLDNYWFKNSWELLKILSFWWVWALYLCLEKKRKQLEDILINNPDSIFVYDIKQWVLTTIKDDSLFSKKEWILSSCKCKLWFKDRGCNIFQLGDLDCPIQKCLKEWVVLDYHRENYRILSYPIKDDKWNILSVVVKIKDVANFQEHWNRLKELAQLAQIDPKTGLYNDRWFLDAFMKKYLQPGSKQKVSICFIDLDDFKKVNDEFWHPVWDIVLKEVARRLLKSVRSWKDIVARWWWDEFVVLLDNISEENLQIKIKNIMQNLNWEFKLENWKKLFIWGTVWYAISEFDSENYTKDIPENRIKEMILEWLKTELVSKADKSMYNNKKNWKTN